MVQTIDMFCSNTVDSIEYGIGFADNIYGTMMELNVMTGCNIGLLLRNDGIIGQQGDTLAPSDNRWIGSDTLDSWADGNPFTDGGNSPFWVRNVVGYYNPGLHDADYLGNSDSIVFHTTTGDTAICDSLTVNKTGSMTSKRDQLIHVLRQNLTDTVGIRANRVWLRKYFAYKFLRTNPAMRMANADLHSFFSMSQNANIGHLVATEELIRQGIAQNDVVYFAQAASSNQNLVPVNQQESIQKAVYDIFLSQLIHRDSLTAAEINALEQIAPLCPHEYGPAVYQARVLLAGVSDRFYDDEACGKSNRNQDLREKESRIAEKSAEKVLVYPVPTQDELRVQYQFKEEAERTFIIFNVLGAKVYQSPLREKSGSIILSFNLPSGVFAYSILETNTSVAIGKIVIVK